MDIASNSNVKSIAIMVFVSVLLFGIFYYLITDVTSSSDLKTTTAQNTQTDTVLADSQKVNNAGAPAQEVKGDTAQVSVFKSLADQKTDVKPKAVLAGSDTRETTQSTVPATGSNTIFVAFVISCLTMFTGIYLLITQKNGVALAKFEKRIIKELD
ncbi:TPA: hypothetical protein DCY43_01100 [candidate division WWE3 bacterium]|uniref:Uncharacterized protein n=3 Tax=Katanobacteria TaxID=422282 RepID=A0A0G1KNP9_UNCKA|nr:MAG: hypothetical protein UW82_C0002G0003 [candidate division WWE3 bacterium GW2011_GWC2_44_9]HAZ29339.1 hypothetical protein [candidate division WWE3 bacterium]